MPEAVRQSERGNIVLYALVLLPVVLSLSVLAVDVSSFQALKEKAQQEADRIALQAVHALPDKAEAERIIRSASADLTDLHLASGEDERQLYSIGTATVSLTLEGRVNAFFDFFIRRAGHGPQTFVLREASEAQMVPADTVIILADAASLRPLPYESWGEGGSWPASKLFNFISEPEIRAVAPGQETPAWVLQWAAGKYQRWVTQSCFNPVYSPLKLAAIGLIDLLGAVDTNRISLVFSPSERTSAGFSVARTLSFPGEEPDAEGEWSSYFEPETFISDEACLYFSDPEASDDYTYRLPLPPAGFGLAHEANACGERYSATPWGASWYPYGRLSPCFTSSALTLRELVYSHAARSIGHGADGVDLIQAANQGIVQLVSDTTARAEDARRRRGNLAAAPLRSIIVLADTVPDVGSAAFAELKRRLEQTKTKASFIVFMPQNIAGYRNPAEQRCLEMARLLGDPEGTVSVFAAANAEELTRTIMPQIVGSSRYYAIRS